MAERPKVRPREQAYWTVRPVVRQDQASEGLRVVTDDGLIEFNATRWDDERDAPFPWFVNFTAKVTHGRGRKLNVAIQSLSLISRAGEVAPLSNGRLIEMPNGGITGEDMRRIPIAHLRELARRQTAQIERLEDQLPPEEAERLAEVVQEPERRRRGRPPTITDDFLFDVATLYFAAKANKTGRAFWPALRIELEKLKGGYVSEKSATRWLDMAAERGFKGTGYHAERGPRYEEFAAQRASQSGRTKAPPRSRSTEPAPRSRTRKQAPPFSVYDMADWTDDEVQQWVNTGDRPKRPARKSKGKKANGR